MMKLSLGISVCFLLMSCSNKVTRSLNCDNLFIHEIDSKEYYDLLYVSDREHTRFIVVLDSNSRMDGHIVKEGACLNFMGYVLADGGADSSEFIYPFKDHLTNSSSESCWVDGQGESICIDDEYERVIRLIVVLPLDYPQDPSYFLSDPNYSEFR